MMGFNGMKRSSSLMRSMVHGLDFFAFWLAGVVAYWWRFDDATTQLLPGYGELMFAFALVLVLVVSNIYRSWRGGRVWALLGRVGLGWLITWGLIMTWLVLTKTSDGYSRLWLTTWAGLSLVMLWACRFAMFASMSALRSAGLNHMRVLLVGSHAMAVGLKRRLRGSSWTGYEVVGIIGAEKQDSLNYTIASLQPDEVWICQPPGDVKLIQDTLHALRHSTANIRLVPDMSLFNLMNHGMTEVVGVPMLDLSSSPMVGLNVMLKWLEDKLLGLTILLLISPLLLVIAVAVKLTSAGPVIFRQQRHGWNGETIEVFKFRSMYVHPVAPDAVAQATKGDPRITPVGRFLRSTSLDELPQFVNVLMGNMSIVGPRPHAVAHNMQYRELIPRYMLRHKVKPGITGWAQVNGLRGETETLKKMEDRVQADLYYIENWSLWLDIKIVVLTVFKGFVGKNAY